MKKIFILLCLLLLTGCNVTYEIKLNNNKIKEKLVLIESNKSLFDVENDTGWTLRQTFDSLLNESDEFSVEEYSVKSLNKEGQLGVEYNSNKISELRNSSVINQCYTNPSFEVNDSIVTINTGTNFTCYDFYDNLETIKVVLTTNHKVISSNADIVEDNKYIWNITENGNKQIEFSYDKDIVNKNYLLIAIVCIGLVSAIVGTGTYVYYKRKRESQL